MKERKIERERTNRPRMKLREVGKRIKIERKRKKKKRNRCGSECHG